VLDVGVAGLVSGLGAIELGAGARVRGASVVKPLLAWAAPDVEGWAHLARSAIAVSDNRATAVLWERAGRERVLDVLADRVGVRWEVADGEEHPALRLLVTAGELAGAYAALAIDRSAAAGDIRRWMREVPDVQTFGVRRVAREVLGVDEAAVAVKCGWFGGVRAHAVVLVELDDRAIGAAVTTHSSPSPLALGQVRAAIGDDDALAAVHDALLGQAVRDAVGRALRASAIRVRS